MLANALALLDANDDEGCLRALLDAWREERSPRIAEVIDLVSARITKSRPEIKAKTIGARTKLWMKIEKDRDPADVERLLATPWPGRWAEALPVLQQIMKWPADPRVGMALARLADEAPYNTWNTYQFWTPLLKHLGVVGDTRILDLLGKKTDDERPFYYRRVLNNEKETIAALQKIKDELPEDVRDPASLEKLRGNFSIEIATQQKTSKGDQELLDAIYRDPDDDSVRQVYADFLSEHGDPRGELITIQLMRARNDPVLTEAMKRREHALLAKHADEWTGDLATWVEEHEREFERGFLAEARINYTALKDLKKAFAHPAWATVRRFDVARVTRENLVLLFACRPTIKALVGLDEVTATWLATGGETPVPTPNEARGLTEIGMAMSYQDIDRTAFGNAPALPNVRRLTFTPYYNVTAFDWLLNGDLWKRLEHATIASNDVATWVGAARKTPSIRSIDLCPGGRRSGRWRAQFTDDAKGERLRKVHIEWESGEGRSWSVTSDLEALIRGAAAIKVSELVIEPARVLHLNAASKKSLEEALAALGAIDRLEVPWEREAKKDEIVPTIAEVAGSLAMHLRGKSLMPQLSELLDDIQELKVTPAFDMFDVNHGIDRPLAKKNPIKQLLVWSKKATTTSMRIFRDGARNLGELHLNKSRHAEKEPDETARWFYRPSHGTNFVCGLPKDADVAFADRYLAFVMKCLERDSISQGHVQPDSHERVMPLALLADSPTKLGWVTILGAHVESLLPRKQLLKLPDTLERAGVTGVSVRATKNNVLLITSPLPRERVESKTVEEIERALTAIFRASYTKEYGYDPFDAIGEALEAKAKSLGFARNTVGLEPTVTGWVRQRGKIYHAVVIDLLSVSRHPQLRVWYKGMLAQADGSHENLDSNWNKQWTLKAHDDDGTDDWSVNSPKAFKRTIEAIDTHLGTDIEEWLSNVQPE